MAQTTTTSEAQGSSNAYTEFNVRRDHGTPHFIRLYDSVVARLERSAAIEKGEAFGILIGTVECDAASCTIAVEHCESSEVVEDHVHSWTAPAGSRQIVVGYYRSHAAARFAMEDADRYLFERCFSKGARVALLVKAPKYSAGAGRIFLGEDGVVEADRVTVEFPFSVNQLGAQTAAPEPPKPAAAKGRSGWMWKAGVTAAVAAASVIGLSAVGHLDRQAPPAPIPSAPLAKPVEATPPALPVPEPVVPAPKKAQPETRRTVTQQPVEGPATQAPAYPDHPRAIRQFAPFVRESLRQSINGEVVVRIRVEVDANGRVISAESLTQGRPLANALAATAVAAAKRWEFEPARPGETILSFAFRR